MPISVRDANGNAVTVATPDEVIDAINAAGGKSSTATVTTVATSTTSATLKAATSRHGLVIYNDAPSRLFVKFGATASASDYTYALQPAETRIVREYIGRIDGILEGDSGTARITELT